MRVNPSFYWHDYETFGADPSQDLPAQFAGIRTDLELNPIEGSELSIYCQPAAGYLPHPMACWITGITPLLANNVGSPEPEFSRLIHAELSQPNTISVGYNSLRFDDEVTRQLLWRNAYDPYQREYANGNSRFDLIDPLRLCYALRPQGLEWPVLDGKPSFRLDQLAPANGIEHDDAHEALADVRATIALAQRFRKAQPKLWNFALSLRDRDTAAALADPYHPEPVLHASQRIPASRGCTSIMLPLLRDPVQARKILMLDLAFDPSELLEMQAEDISDRWFASQADLPEGEKRLPLKFIKLNAVPMLAPLSVLKGVDCARIDLHVEVCLKHAQQVKAKLPQLRQVLTQVLAQRASAEDTKIAALPIASARWPTQAPNLYEGFLSDAERDLLKRFNADPAQHWASASNHSNPRIRMLVQLYRSRHLPQSLSVDEYTRYLAAHRDALEHGGRSLSWFMQELQQLRLKHPDCTDFADELEAYARAQAQQFDARWPTAT